MIATAIATLIALKAPQLEKIRAGDIKLSRRAISLENLVRILPLGFESKNKMRDLSKVCVAFLSKLFDADIIITKIYSPLINESRK